MMTPEREKKIREITNRLDLDVFRELLAAIDSLREVSDTLRHEMHMLMQLGKKDREENERLQKYILERKI